MKSSNSSYTLQRESHNVNRQKSIDKYGKSQHTNYSKMDNKENQITQPKPNKYTYSAMHQAKQVQPQPEITDTQSNIDERRKLMVIFKFYASFGDRTNVDYLKSNKIHKLVADAQLRNLNGLDSKQLDIIFVKATKNRPNMDFDNFCLLLFNISDYIYGDDSMEQLMQQHLNPLYDNIINSTDLGDDESKFQQELDPICLSLLNYVSPVLKVIHIKYFPPHFKSFNMKENSTSEEFKIKSQSKSQMFQFLKEFEICPQLITKGTAILLYDSILEDQQLPDVLTKNKSQRFNLNHFACYIAKLAQIAFSNFEDEEEVTQLQKQAFLLERMEMSPGFMSLECPTVSSKHFKLRVPEEIIELLMTDPNALKNIVNQSQSQQFKIHQLRDEIFEDKPINRRMNTQPGRQSKQSLNQVDQKKYEDYSETLFQQYTQELYNIYKTYAGVHPQTGVENELMGSKWLKLLKDANLVNSSCLDTTRGGIHIPHSEVDIIFAKSCQNIQRGSVQRKPTIRNTLTFNQFCRALQLLGKDSQTLKIIIEEHILRLMCRGSESKMRDMLTSLMGILKDKEIVEFLGLLNKSVLMYYKVYANAKGLMTFEQLLKFYKDFQIFPDLITKSKAISIFQMLSKLYEQNQGLAAKCGVIDQHMFVESLALCGLQIQYNDDNMSQLERICYLVERMNQSEGPRIVQKQLGHTICPSGQDWDMLHTIRKRFQWLFQQDQSIYQ